MQYEPRVIEKKWQKFWKENRSHEPSEDSSKPKKYILSMFPYPSGDLHMGHVRNYSIGDAMARYYRKQGFNVLHPIGFDAFGMPAENAAIKHGIHPKNWTYQNIQKMTQEFETLGLSFSKDRELATCDPVYTKWEQEFFIKMWQKGLVYRKKALLNWCPNDQTVLANEQVIDNKCWRCDTPVEQKEMFQYYIKITDYADELLKDLEKLKGTWPDAVLVMQRNWIGKSSGLEFKFQLEREVDGIKDLEVFTTRADTIFGVSYCALAPEHPLVKAILPTLNAEQQEQILSIQRLNARARSMGDKIGVDLGINAIHPITKEKIPLWMASFVLHDYGSGAVMSVPAHDERDHDFALKYHLPIKKVIKNEHPFEDQGILENSLEFNGLHTKDAREAIIDFFEKQSLGRRVINFRLKDWGISRQRYWGAPIPLVHCEKCGIVPEKIENLPITLPDDVIIDGEGNPLDKHLQWQKTFCPKCSSEAKRETDTMDTFFQSSWYFLRYTTPQHLMQSVPFDFNSAKYWMAVDEYIGGIEHAVLHLLYARFFTKVLRDLGYIDLDEPFLNLLTQGMVLKDGRKMSKSVGNVVTPSEIIEEYSIDTARLFMLFAAPPVKDLEWIDLGVKGAFRFICRFFEKTDKITKTHTIPTIDHKLLAPESKEARKKVYEALQKSEDIFSKKQANFPFNTLIASCMEAFNAMNAQDDALVWTEGYFVLSHILEPIIPHVCWEISSLYFDFKNFEKISVDQEALQTEDMILIISVNGKKRSEISLPKTMSQEEIIEKAKQKAQKWLPDNLAIKKEIYVPNKLINFVI